jgi:hypothetical protein
MLWANIFLFHLRVQLNSSTSKENDVILGPNVDKIKANLGASYTVALKKNKEKIEITQYLTNL